MNTFRNLILIGMPSSGKSTAGNLLAKRLHFDFIDCDKLIEQEEGKQLSRIIAAVGTEGFMSVEERVCLSVLCDKSVVSTGGSVVYSEAAMSHFKSLGLIVYLKIDRETVNARIKNFEARGVVMRGNISTLSELYFERVPLYERYADVTVDCSNQSVEETVASIVAAVGGVS